MRRDTDPDSVYSQSRFVETPPMPSDDVSRATELRARIEADIRSICERHTVIHRYVDSAQVNEVGLGAQVNDDVRHIMADIDELCRRATAPAATGEPVAWIILDNEGNATWAGIDNDSLYWEKESAEAECRHLNEDEPSQDFESGRESYGYGVPRLRPYTVLPVLIPSPSSLPAIPAGHITISVPRKVAEIREAQLLYENQLGIISENARTEWEAYRTALAPVPPVDVRGILDPDFTGGLSPVEYLDRLHSGTLDRSAVTPSVEPQREGT